MPPIVCSPATVLERVDARLRDTDVLLNTAYPGDDGSRQPVHTVYVPADRAASALPSEWGAAALAATEQEGGLATLAERRGSAGILRAQLASRVRAKLAA